MPNTGASTHVIAYKMPSVGHPPHQFTITTHAEVLIIQTKLARRFLTVDPEENARVMHALSSPVRVRILRLLRGRGELNVNEICAALELPQSTVATNVNILDHAGLIDKRTIKARKGQQKLCASRFDEIIIRLDEKGERKNNEIIVEMPLGLYTGYQVSAPCGLCSQQGIIGVLDVPDLFLDPRRMQTSLIWFGRGFLEYKFPNNARIVGRPVTTLEFSMELSSEVPGTNPNWPSDVSVWINDVQIGTWTSPGDFGDKRGRLTPGWWKLEGSQYGRLTRWTIDDSGSYLDGEPLSAITLGHLELHAHHSIRFKIGIRDEAEHPGGINIFGRGFGDHDQDLVMRLLLAD